ncbi:hypothetical protein T492DRAFT_862305 [Pavlovales sp. CCMP2436]|nr:hypothetical protein T492DRAFT_862305 [Pavlovales sp. CCMP2436]
MVKRLDCEAAGRGATTGIRCALLSSLLRALSLLSQLFVHGLACQLLLLAKGPACQLLLLAGVAVSAGKVDEVAAAAEASAVAAAAAAAAAAMEAAEATATKTECDFR